MSDKVLTGRKVLLMFVAFFAVIIGVNLTLAYQAVKTFPGLETRNAYETSQSFNRDRAAQIALGWNVVGTVSAGKLRLSIRDSSGNPVQLAGLEATLGRATNAADDTTPVFEFDGEDYVTPVDLAPGNWNLRMVATAQNGTAFHQRVVILMKDVDG